jgi:aminoglycoside phosphotransferase (APT) family kinase protein
MLDLMDAEFAAVDAGIAAGIDWLRGRRAIVADEAGTVAICHNDYHPLNVLVDAQGHATVLDWADAKIGDYHCDVARALVVFSVAPLAAGSTIERIGLRAAKGWMARRYRRAYQQTRTLDAERLQYWMTLHALFGWGQVASLHAGRFDGETRHDNAARVSPRLAPGLRSTFEQLRAGI